MDILFQLGIKRQRTSLVAMENSRFIGGCYAGQPHEPRLGMEGTVCNLVPHRTSILVCTARYGSKVAVIDSRAHSVGLHQAGCYSLKSGAFSSPSTSFG